MKIWDSVYICNRLNVVEWTGPLACLSLFSVVSVEKGQYFNLETCSVNNEAGAQILKVLEKLGTDTH